MGNKSRQVWDYIVKYVLPLLVTILVTVGPSVIWLSTILAKLDGNIQILTNALNDSVIPILAKISGETIPPIGPTAQNAIRQTFADSLYRQQQQLAISIDKITLAAKNGNDKTVEENIRPVLPGIYSFLAKWHDEQGNTAEVRVALNAYFHYYSENTQLKPPSQTYAMMQDLERKYGGVARKE